MIANMSSRSSTMWLDLYAHYLNKYHSESSVNTSITVLFPYSLASFSWSPIFSFSSDRLFCAIANFYFRSFSFCLNYLNSLAFSSYLLINLSYLSFCSENWSFNRFISAFDASSASVFSSSYCSTLSSYFWKSFLYFYSNFWIFSSSSPFSFYRFFTLSSSFLYTPPSLSVWKKSLFLAFFDPYYNFLASFWFY